jgi:hypothetical protein
MIKERGEEEISLKKIGSFPKVLMITLNREDLDHELKQQRDRTWCLLDRNWHL